MPRFVLLLVAACTMLISAPLLADSKVDAEMDLQLARVIPLVNPVLSR